jgi:hypothetical protein
LVINASPDHSLREQIVLDARWRPHQLMAYLLDGPSSVAFNTGSRPELVRVTESTVELGPGKFLWPFPSHSVTLLQWQLLQWQTGRSAQRQSL